MSTRRFARALVLLSLIAAVASPRYAGAQEAEAPEPPEPPPPPEQPAEPDVTELAQQLQSLVVDERLEAIDGLVTSGDRRVSGLLARTLRSEPSPDVRVRLVQALAELGTASADTAVCVASRNETNSRVQALASRLCSQPSAPTPVIERFDVSSLTPTEAAALARLLLPYLEEAEEEIDNDPNHRLLKAGWIVFGVAAGCTLIEGVIASIIEPEIGSYNMIPLVGPMVTGIFAFQDGWEESIVYGAVSFLMSAMQITGFALALTGHVRQRRARREQGGEGDERASIWERLVLAPTGGRNFAGLGLAGWF